MPYATIADVRAAGVPAAALDAQLTAAIAQAQERVDVFTGDVFETRALTVRGVMSGGLARLPLRAQSVSAVRYDTPTGPALDASSYFVTSSAVRGDVDAVRLTGSGYGGVDLRALLDVTYEPFRSSSRDDVPVYVTGSFGYAVTPDAVRDATVLLAIAELADVGVLGESGAVNVEGDADLSSPPRVPTLTLDGGGSSGGDFERQQNRTTTGVPEADRLLQPYRRSAQLLVS